jgi:hypothetical protein
VVSFRLAGYGAALLCGAPPPEETPDAPLVVQPNFEILAPRSSPYARFQLGRFAEEAGGAWRLTRRSIQTAAERGVAADEILRFLEEQSGREAPQNVAATLREWSGRYGQLTLRRGVVLRSEDQALLEQARRDPRVKMPAAEPIGERAWLVREGDAAELAERLKRAGYGVDADDAAAGPLSERDLAVMVEALEFYAEACELLRLTSDASGAMRRRASRLVRERELNRALQASHAALRALRGALAGVREGQSVAAASTAE